MSNNNKIRPVDKYEGSKNKDGLPHGKGKNISIGVDGKISLIEEGVWKNGFLVEGSETLFGNQQNDGSYAIKKEVGKWRFDEKKNYCEEYPSGEGKELYYKNEKDFKNDKPMGYVKGKSLLHLQCHFGQDSISLAKMGADVTGVDFSNVAITEARKLAHELKASVQFIENDVLNLTLEKEFDISQSNLCLSFKFG